jgi:carbamoyl-phosphate synthase large subunit
MINILVTGTSGTNTGTQIMSALLLYPDRYRVVVTDIEKHSYGANKVDAYYIVPLADSPYYVYRILEICAIEKIDVLIPGSESELKVCSDNRKPFDEAKVHLLINNENTINICMDKVSTIRFLGKNGFPFPKSLILENGVDIEKEAGRVLGQLRLPLILKPYLNSGGSNNLYLARSKEELLFHLNLLKGRNDLQMMVQEYEGSSEDEYTVGVMSDEDGVAFTSFALKRLINTSFTRKMHLPNLHKSRVKADFLTISTGVSQGWVDDFPEVRELSEKVANALGSSGPLNIQCRKTERGIVIFEINPRFSGTTSIRAICGHNDPDILIRSRIYKEKFTQVKYRKGLVLRSLENLFVEDMPSQKHIVKELIHEAV